MLPSDVNAGLRNHMKIVTFVISTINPIEFSHFFQATERSPTNERGAQGPHPVGAAYPNSWIQVIRILPQSKYPLVI